MNKQTKLKSIPVVITLIAIITVYTILFGNPLFAFFAENTANRYLLDNYPDCYIDRIVYDGFGLFSGYRAVIKSEHDTTFEEIIYIDITGLAVNQKAMDFYHEK